MKKSAVRPDLLWLRQITSFGPARVVLTANKFRLFDHLDGRGLTGSMLATRLRTDPRATGTLLDCLAAIGLLKKRAGRYTNASVASRYLVAGRPDYQGDILRHYHALWENWSGLDAVVKTGRPFRRARDHEAFILGMHNLAALKVEQVMEALPLQNVRRAIDVGGGPGTYAMAFARRGIETTLFDFPATVKIARRLVRAAGLGRKVRLVGGDFTGDDIGSGYDLVFLSQILHAYDPDACQALIGKAAAALNPGGKVVVQEFYLDETRTAPLWGALFSINMLVNTAGGRTYTPKEIVAWMKRSGLRSIGQKRQDETVLITGSRKG